MALHFQPPEEWARSKVADMPRRWGDSLMGRWKREHDGAPDGPGQQDKQRAANIFHREQVDKLAALRLPLDANDAQICAHADHMAARASEMAGLYHTLPMLRGAMERLAKGQGVRPPLNSPAMSAHVEDGPAVSRMADPLWWRRQLRVAHGRAVEGAAITLGWVSRARDIYASNESVNRRQQQNRRNAQTLENTTARNEQGQEFTLAELAEKSPANKRIRRAELMTRIAGFERIALGLGHVGVFLTITCPSRFHKWRTVGKKAEDKRVIENKRYANLTPREGQEYLQKVWSRARSKLHKRKLGAYGFRVAEPQHDATPHWHLLLFVEPERVEELREIVRHYALQDSPNEPGAQEKRVDFKAIDPERGTAAGYIAKYVAKNIDGHALKTDLCGDEFIEADGYETAQRVEAWATTWGIRQFQQIGGAPVGVWRELRRIKELPAGAPAHLVKAHNAVNKVAVIEGKEKASVAWDHYCQAQGGVFCGRDYLIRLDMQQPEGINRYGEPMSVRPVGVYTSGIETWTPPWMAHMNPPALIERRVEWFVESTRFVWTIQSKRRGEGGGVPIAGKAKPSTPWTRVNNCTEGNSDERGIEDGAGQGGMEQSPGAYQIGGGSVHGAGFGRDGGNAGPHRAPGGGNRERLRGGLH